jgi:DNA repair protein RecO (recombination protein O)
VTCSSEAFVLRTYPYRESSVVVSFFTRDKGKLRGAARGVKKPKSKFGSGLERLSLIRMHYSERENRDLVFCTACDLLYSQFPLASDYGASLVLDFMAEVTEHLLPPHEPNDRFFRLLATSIDHLHANPPQNLWPALLYFAFWAVRLGGFLASVKNLSESSQQLTQELATRPIAELSPRIWTREQAADLRLHLIHAIENHIERRLATPPLLATI